MRHSCPNFRPVLYLKKQFYNVSKKRKTKFSETVQKIKLSFSTKDQPTKYYEDNHNHIPPWILFKNVYFNSVIDLFTFLNKNMQLQIVNDYSLLKKMNIKNEFKTKNLKKMLTIIRKFRNKIAHNAKIFNYRVENTDEILHQEIKGILPNDFINFKDIRNNLGKTDMFAMIFSIVILLDNSILRLLFLNEIKNAFDRILKSKFGNKLTKFVFRLFYGRKITDTQTGLRGFPKDILREMIDIPGERFEYETKMLIHMFEENISIKETTIETIYYDNNAETHFNPIKDSLRIYKVIFGSFFKYLISSLSSFIVDIGLFQLILWISLATGFSRGTVPIIVATVIARIFSSYFNFTINKNFVFNGEKSIRKTIIKYYSLAIVQMILSAILVSAVWHIIFGSETIIKIVVDTILFFVSYQIQRRWVFRK
mgnify:CR=1 FL=1